MGEQLTFLNFFLNFLNSKFKRQIWFFFAKQAPKRRWKIPWTHLHRREGHISCATPKFYEFWRLLSCFSHLNEFKPICACTIKFELQVWHSLLLPLRKKYFGVPKQGLHRKAIEISWIFYPYTRITTTPNLTLFWKNSK